MSGSSTPLWHEPGNVQETISKAVRNSTVNTQDIVEVLVTHELDAPRERVEKLVEVTPDEPPRDRSTKTDLADPRATEPRYIDTEDVAYLSSNEFATVLGAALSRYEGSFRTPEDIDKLDVDLFWTRQHTTVALRTVPKEPGGSVGEGTVNHVVRGKTSPPTGRSPSVVGIVTNAGFTNQAGSIAEDNDVKLFGRNFLDRWLSDGRLTPEIVGQLLDEREQAEMEVDELFDDLPPLPEPVKNRDVLSDSKTRIDFETTSARGGTSERESGGRSQPPVETPSTKGKRGELYADPEEDGDYGALDDYMEELSSDGGSR